MQSVTAYVDDETEEVIQAVTEHHDISQSAAIRLLLREGISQRSRRYQNELLDAKLNRLLSELGIDNIDQEVAEERYQFALENTVPDATIDQELNDMPLPEFLFDVDAYDGSPREQQAKREQTE
jgi:hypothetical protein